MNKAIDVANRTEWKQNKIESSRKQKSLFATLNDNDHILLGRSAERMREKTLSRKKSWKAGPRERLGEEKLDVYFCPGHTPGHIIFYSENNKLALVGDVLFNGSIGRTDLPGGNHDQLINSVKEKLWPLGKDIEFIPGHGPMSNFEAERLSNPFVSDKALGII